MAIHEMYGHLAESFDAEQSAHLETINLLRRIAAGEVIPSQLQITHAGAWSVMEASEQHADDSEDI